MKSRSLLNCFLNEELYIKGVRFCCVGTNTINDRRELIAYDSDLDDLNKKVKSYLHENYDGIKNYKIFYPYLDSKPVLFYRSNSNDKWELKEEFHIELGRPQDFYDDWNSRGDGSLTKPAKK